MKTVEFNFERDIKPLSFFARRICHDLNNLITGSMGATSLLELKLNSIYSVDLSKELERLHHSTHNYQLFTQRLNQIFQDISPMKTSLDFNIILKSASEIVSRPISIQYLDAPCKVNMDAAQMTIAIQEIIYNAIDATPEGQAISIVLTKTIEEGIPWISFSCQDQGRGMREETMDALFTPFFSEGKRGNLVGLGLPQAGHLIYQHGSTLKVSSEEGKGTTVSFKIQACPD